MTKKGYLHHKGIITQQSNLKLVNKRQKIKLYIMIQIQKNAQSRTEMITDNTQYRKIREFQENYTDHKNLK